MMMSLLNHVFVAVGVINLICLNLLRCEEQHSTFKVLPQGLESVEDSSACPPKNSKLPVFLPHPDDCSKFYICDSGVAHLKDCQHGLHFNPKMKVCDYPENAGCDEAFKELPKGRQIEDGFSVCPVENSERPFFIPHPNDCNNFYQCDGGLAVLRNCPHGLHFNPSITACDHPVNARCGKGNEVSLSGVPSPFCPAVNGKIPIFFRHPTNCSVYYMCSHGLAYEFVCPARLHFSLRKQVCDYEWNSGCQNSDQ